MADHVQRMVERCNRRDCANRFALGKDFTFFAVMGQVAGKNLAIIVQGLMGGELINVLRALGLVNCVLVADAQFQHQPFGQIVAPFTDQHTSALQDLATLVARQGWGVVCRNLKRPFRVLARHRYMRLPAMDTNTSSRCHRASGRGRVVLSLRA